MATNLRSKIAESDTMIVCDVNPAVSEKFAKEIGNVEVGKNVRDVAEKAVCAFMLQHLRILLHHQDECYLFYL